MRYAPVPFYLYLSHYAVHAPWEEDERFYHNYEQQTWDERRKRFASMLEGMDHSLGRVMEAIDRLGIRDNTVLVFMSDNGCPQQLPQNLPLRGHKISAYEGGTRVPLMVRWPDHAPANERTESSVIIEDLFPTFLEIAGVDTLPECDGRSFVPVIHDPATEVPARPMFWHYPNLYDQPPFSVVLLDDLKLIYWHTDQSFELFNIREDIGETTDLAGQRPDEVKRLAEVLANHLRETGAFMLTDRASQEPIPFPDEVL